MANIHQTDATGHAYARSLLELATESGQAEAIGAELTDLDALVRDNPIFGEFLADPAVGATERDALLDKVLRGRISQLTFNFLGVMARNGRLHKLHEIAVAYDDLLESQLGNIEVDVTTAHHLSNDELENVRARVGQALGKKPIIQQFVDESIIGGLVLRVGDKLIDASVRHQLQAMKRQLLSATPS